MSACGDVQNFGCGTALTTHLAAAHCICLVGRSVDQCSLADLPKAQIQGTVNASRLCRVISIWLKDTSASFLLLFKQAQKSSSGSFVRKAAALGFC